MEGHSNLKSSAPGLAVDIDETLSWTVYCWMEEMMNLFGNPENLSIQEMIDKYGYSHKVPYWKTKEANEWMEKKRMSNDFQKNLPLIKGSNHYLNEINKLIPIFAYLTIRPKSVSDGTKFWLTKHGFPKVQIIFRPDNISSAEGNLWKAGFLAQNYPKIRGFIDDNKEVIENLPKDYKGMIIYYNKNSIVSQLHHTQCTDWSQIYNEIKKQL